MPWSPPKHCPAGHPPYTGRACPECAAKRRAVFDKRRPSARARGYTKAWEKARADFLATNPRCARCGSLASVVDHIRPHRGDRRLFWDRTNWQPLCASCHSSHKQREEHQAGGRFDF